MRSWLLGQHIAQLHKCRAVLDDQYSPATEIQRPPGMKKYLFEARIKRIIKLEAKIRYIVAEDSHNWVKKTYKA